MSAVMLQCVNCKRTWRRRADGCKYGFCGVCGGYGISISSKYKKPKGRIPLSLRGDNHMRSKKVYSRKPKYIEDYPYNN